MNQVPVSVVMRRRLPVDATAVDGTHAFPLWNDPVTQGDFDNTLSKIRGKVDATHALHLQGRSETRNRTFRTTRCAGRWTRRTRTSKQEIAGGVHEGSADRRGQIR